MSFKLLASFTSFAFRLRRVVVYVAQVVHIFYVVYVAYVASQFDACVVYAV